MTRRATGFWLFAIVAVAALLRLAHLNSNPAGLFRDEAEKGYSAWSLARTGCIVDLTDVPADPATGLYVPVARRWPLFINVWGSQTSTIYQAFDMPFVAWLGPTWFAVRLPAALAGILTTFLAWSLARELARDNRVGLWAAGLVAVGPWDVVLSRWAHQGILVPAFVAAGVWAAARAARSERRPAGLFALAGAAQALAFYAYSGARPFLLVFWAGAALLFGRQLWARRRALGPGLVVFAAILAPSLWAMLGAGGAGMGRFSRVSIFGAGLSPLGTAGLFLRNYFAHFSPAFLFFTGDANPRHGAPGFGVLLAVEAVWLVAGLCVTVRRAVAREAALSPGARLLLLWFALFPLSAALTNEGIPHALRTLHAVPAPQVLSAIGAVWCADWLRRRAGRVAAAAPAVLTACNAAVFALALFAAYPARSAGDFEQGVADVVAQYRSAAAGKPGRLYVVPGPGVAFVYELYLFHLRVDPASLAGLPLERYPVQAVPPDADPARVLRVLGPGDAVLLSTATANNRPSWQAPQALVPGIEFRSDSSRSLSVPSWWPGREGEPGARRSGGCTLVRRSP